MTNISRNFTDDSDDVLEITFDNETGDLVFEGDYITRFEFTADDTFAIVEFLVTQLNSLTPEPLVAEVVTTPTVTTGDSPRESFNLTALQAAKELGLGVAFKYSKGNTGNIEPRTLAEVEYLRETSKGHTVVYGYDEDREDPRTFRVDWIKGFVTVTD